MVYAIVRKTTKCDSPQYVHAFAYIPVFYLQYFCMLCAFHNLKNWVNHCYVMLCYGDLRKSSAWKMSNDSPRRNKPQSNIKDCCCHFLEEFFTRFTLFVVLSCVGLWFIVSIQSTLSVRGSPRLSPQLQRKDSKNSRRSQLRHREDSRSLVDSQSDSADEPEEESNRRGIGSRRNSTNNNYRCVNQHWVQQSCLWPL